MTPFLKKNLLIVFFSFRFLFLTVNNNLLHFTWLLFKWHYFSGLDLIVVVTKTDYIADLERDYDYKEEHFDFIQQSIRHFCLQFGGKKC